MPCDQEPVALAAGGPELGSTDSDCPPLGWAAKLESVRALAGVRGDGNTNRKRATPTATAAEKTPVCLDMPRYWCGRPKEWHRGYSFIGGSCGIISLARSLRQYQPFSGGNAVLLLV